MTLRGRAALAYAKSRRRSDPKSLKMSGLSEVPCRRVCSLANKTFVIEDAQQHSLRPLTRDTQTSINHSPADRGPALGVVKNGLYK